MKKLILFIILFLNFSGYLYSQEISRTYFSIHTEKSDPYYNLISILDNIPDSLNFDTDGIIIKIKSDVRRRNSILSEDYSTSVMSVSETITVYPKSGINESGDRVMEVKYNSDPPVHKVCYIPSSRISGNLLKVCFKSLPVSSPHYEKTFITVTLDDSFYKTAWIFMNYREERDSLVAPVDGGTEDCYLIEKKEEKK